MRNKTELFCFFFFDSLFACMKKQVKEDKKGVKWRRPIIYVSYFKWIIQNKTEKQKKLEIPRNHSLHSLPAHYMCNCEQLKSQRYRTKKKIK